MVGDQPSAACVLRQRARHDVVGRDERSQPAIHARGFLRGLADDRHIEADDLGDLFEDDTLFSNSVIPSTRRTLLQRQAKETRGIQPMHRGPTVAPITDIG